VAIVLVIEVLVHTQRARFMDGVFRAADMKREMLSDPARRDDVAYFGDSRDFSVSPATMASALGTSLTVTNYSWPFIGAEAYDLMLSAYLAAKRPPAVLLVGFMPEYVALDEKHLLMDGEDVRRVRAYNAVPTASLLRSLVAERNWPTLWDWFSWYCMPPTSKNREGILAALRSIGRQWSLPGASEGDKEMVRSLSETGAYLLYPTVTANPNDIQRFLRLFAPVQVHDNQQALDRFEAFLRRAQANGVQVRLLNVPTPQPIYDLYEKNGVLERFRVIIREWEQRYPGFRAVQPIVYPYPLDHFGDFGHMNRKGDERFQRDCAEMLRRSVEEGRIPPLSPGPSAR
jgi:hypothetical protein